MDIFLIADSQVTPLTAVPDGAPARGFLWLDAIHEEVAADPEAWREAVARATGTHLYDPHLTDVVNLAHPSYFDSTNDYAMLVFRKLALTAEGAPAAAPDATANAAPDDGARRRVAPLLTRLATVPVSFLLLDHALVTVHAPNSRTIEAARARLLEARERADGGAHGARRPTSPEDLMLRLLNAMVDQYLELRQPLTAQLDRWQRALLDPRRPFRDWLSLLDARIELRKLDHLCEEQHDALQELRDHVIEGAGEAEISRSKDLLLVRINDVMEHVTRVLNHARRLESSIESAVQIHFSAMSHRTSEIMRTLTVITALFMPLTLITGIFGMNFVEMPLLKDRAGFWLTMAAMALVVVIMLVFFRSRRYLDEQVPGRRRRDGK